MNTKAKSTSVMTTEWAGNVLSINLIGAGTVMFDAEKASTDNRDAAQRHGWTQRLCDKAAIPAPQRKPGQTDDQWAAIKAQHVQAKFKAVQELAEYYMGGEVPWRMTGTGGGDGGLLLTALCRLRPDRTVKQVGDFLDSRTPEQLKLVRARRDVVEMMNQVRLERAGDTDNSEALDELDAM